MDRGIPVYPLFLERVERCKWIQYYRSPHQWSDTFDVSLGTRLCELVKAAQKSSSDSGSYIEFMTAMLEEDISRVPQPSKQDSVRFRVTTDSARPLNT